jgi:hypothetical protein
MLLHVSEILLIVGSLTGVVARRATRTDDSISPTAVDYHSDEDDLESVVADLMDHDAFVDIGTENDVAIEVEDVEDCDVGDLTSAFSVSQFFQHFDSNIEWGGYEYDHDDSAMDDSDDDSNEG